MKRLVSSVLTLAMVLSLAGCSKKSEESTRATKQTTASEATTTESETDETTTTESETEETTTTESETEETTTKESETEGSTTESKSGDSGLASYTISPDFKIHSDLQKVLYETRKEKRAYGFVASVEDNKINSLRKECDLLTVIDEDNYSQLWNTLDGIFPAMNSNFDDIYEQKLPSYVDGSATDSLSITNKTFVVRSDSEVFSFVTYQNTNSSTSFFKTYNYRSGDSMEYTLDDVVTDRAGFSKFFSEYISGAIKDDAYSASDLETVKALAKKISDPNQAVPFLLTYDGILIVYTQDYAFSMFKIPAVYAGDYIDMSLFGGTPESYVLQSDEYNHIIWDIDGDGTLDEISAVSETDEYDSLISFGISVNGKVEKLPDSELDYSDMGLYKFYLLKAADGFYVYAEVYLESSDAVIEVFKYDGSSFKYQKGFFGNLPNMHIDGFFFDPSNFTISHSSDIMGTGYVIDNVFAEENDGMPKRIVKMGERYQIVATRQELTVNKFSNNGTPDGTATLPEKAVFAVIGIDLEKRTLLCQYLDADESKNFYFELNVDPAQNEEDYSLKYNGIEQNDLFLGLFYAG